MYVVDASVWASRFLADDVHHLPSHAWLRDRVSAGDELAVPAIALPEVAAAVARRANSAEAGLSSVGAMEGLPTIRLVPVDHALARLATEMGARLRLRGMDSIYLALARFLNIPLVTWDKELQRRGAAVVEAVTPLDTD